MTLFNFRLNCESIMSTAVVAPRRHHNRLWLAVFLACILCGCGRPTHLEDPDQVVRVHGNVVYKGQLLAGAQLTFHREGPGESAFGVTDERGQYTGMTNDTSGMYPGEYRVTVIHPRIALPKKYADVESSPLEMTVFEEEANQEFLVQLND